jgi:integrase
LEAYILNDLMTIINALPRDVLGLIEQIAPELSTLSEEQRNHVFKKAAYNKLTDKAGKVLTIAAIDWQTEREAFLNSYQSPHTRRTYGISLTRYENWANREGINPAATSYGKIDNFINDLKAEGRAAVSVRTNIAAVSAFFTFLERRHEGIKNAVRGTKKRPAEEPKKPPKVPTESEVETIISNAKPPLAAALSVMAYRGLRCGALSGLSAWGGMFETRSKGKTIRGTLPERAVKAIEAAGLSLKKPFEGLATNNFEKEVEYHIKRLYKTGKLSRRDAKGDPVIFHCHSFRHYFAVTEYAKDKDIHRVKELLSQSSIAVTDRYLRSLTSST